MSHQRESPNAHAFSNAGNPQRLPRTRPQHTGCVRPLQRPLGVGRRPGPPRCWDPLTRRHSQHVARDRHSNRSLAPAGSPGGGGGAETRRRLPVGGVGPGEWREGRHRTCALYLPSLARFKHPLSWGIWGFPNCASFHGPRNLSWN